MMKGLRGIVPHRVLFLLFTSLRFVPFFAREMQEITMAQRLRGARLSPRDVRRPVFWGDLFSCIILPLLVRALKTADEAALSAESRGMGARTERTYYDVRELERYLASSGQAPLPPAERGACPEITMKETDH